MTCVHHALQIRPQSILARGKRTAAAQCSCGCVICRRIQDALVLSALMNATADGQMGRTITVVRAWFKFCEIERISPLRARIHKQISKTNCWRRLSMRFCATIVGDRMGKLCAGLSMKRLPQMIRRRLMLKTPQAELLRSAELVAEKVNSLHQLESKRAIYACSQRRESSS